MKGVSKMSGQILTRLKGRNIVYRDEIALLHRAKGIDRGGRNRLFWTLCHKDAPAEEVRPQTRGERVTCPECQDALSGTARQILAVPRLDPRPAVSGLPF